MDLHGLKRDRHEGLNSTGKKDAGAGAFRIYSKGFCNPSLGLPSDACGRPLPSSRGCCSTRSVVCELENKRKMLNPMNDAWTHENKTKKVSCNDNIYEEFLLIGPKVQKLPWAHDSTTKVWRYEVAVSIMEIISMLDWYSFRQGNLCCWLFTIIEERIQCCPIQMYNKLWSCLYGARFYQLRIELSNNIAGRESSSMLKRSNQKVCTYTGNAKDRVLVVLLSDRREMLPE